MARKTKKAATTGDLQEDLSAGILDAINATSEDGIDTAFILGQHESPADITGWVSTGCDTLDLAIANRPGGGYPVGRIVEVTGLEGSGKSLLAAHALASTQKNGGLGVYFDTESAISPDFLEAIGVDTKKLLYIQMDNLEDIFEAMVTIIEKVRASSADRQVTLVLDSVMAASTKIELDAGFDKDGYATQKAIILSKAMRKITNLIARENILFIATNQLRVKMGVTFGEKYGTSGGKALAFHASVRLRTKALGKIKIKRNGQDVVVGIKTRVVVQKNRMGPPHRVVDYHIYFDSGIDNFGGLLTELKNYKIVKSAGAWYSYGDTKFQSKDFRQMCEEDPAFRAELYDALCDKYIMVYTPGLDGGIDDIIIDKGEDALDEPDEVVKVKIPKSKPLEPNMEFDSEIPSE